MSIITKESADPENKYLEMINNLDVGFYQGEFKGKLLMHNRTLNKILGIDPSKDLTGTSATQFFYNPEDHEKYNEELMKNGHIRNLIAKIKKINGDIIIVEVNAHIVKNVDRELLTVEGTIIDRTEKYQIEQKLIDFEKKFKAIFDNSSDLIAFLNKEFIHEFINENAYLNVLGYSREDIIGKRARDFIHPEDMIQISKTLKKGFLKGKFSDEHRVKHKNGHYILVETKGNFIMDNGQIKGLIYISRVITERKEAERKLKESEEKYRTLFKDSIKGICIVKDDRIIDANQALLDIFGYISLEEFKKKSVFDYVAPESREAVMENYINLQKGISIDPRFEVKFIRKDGKIIDIESYNSEIFIGNDKYYQTTFRDITERKKAIQKLKDSEHQLDLKVKELTTLYELSKLVETLDISLEDLILGTLNIIPPAYQFPDITTARIIYKDRAYLLENFRETKWKMSIKMMIMKFPILIEVCYLENKSFKSEEYDLLIEIGTQLKRILDGREIQKKLKESEETYRLLFESSTDGIASADMEGNFIEINKVFLDLLGYSREELLKLNFRDITPQKWHEMEDNLIIKQFSEEKDSGIYEKEYIQKDGTIIPIDIRFWIVKDNQGDPIRMWFIVRDITNRKIVEKEISDLAKFPSENPNPVLRATQNRILYANKSGIELLKVDIEGNIPEFLHEIIQESLLKNIKQELDIELANQIYSFTISPIKVMGYVNIYGINITDRIKAEEEIANLAKFPSEDPYPVLRVNLNNILYINNAGQKLLKIDENDEIPVIFRVKINEAFINNAITEVEAILNSRIYSFNIIPIIESNYINIYGMDITERKHVEQKLKEVNKLKSEFLRRASHELKTPLISIKGFSELILNLYEDQLDEPIISKLREIDDGCERLQNIINNLLKTSRLELPDLRPKIQKEDLSFLIKFCLHELQSLAERRKQSINLDIHSELHANIEKEEIHDVISNLVTNAIKYTPPRGKINIKTELKEDFVVVSIKDNGIGFTEDQKKKIFQQFGKIERYGQGLDLGIDGTGLGLYISKRIVESHGGKIWMESEGRNKGSTFYFTIPTVK